MTIKNDDYFQVTIPTANSDDFISYKDISVISFQVEKILYYLEKDNGLTIRCCLFCRMIGELLAEIKEKMAKGESLEDFQTANFSILKKVCDLLVKLDDLLPYRIDKAKDKKNDIDLH